MAVTMDPMGNHQERVFIHPDARHAFKGKTRVTKRFPPGTDQKTIDVWRKDTEAEILRARHVTLKESLEIPVQRDEWSFGGMAVEWEQTHTCGHRTLANYKILLAKYVTPHLGPLKSRQVTKAAIKDMLLELRRQGVTEHNAQRALKTVKAILRWATEQDPPIPVDAGALGVKVPKPAPTFVRDFDPLAVDHALASVTGRDRALLVVAASTGMRREELRRFDCRWIRWEEGRIRIPAIASEFVPKDGEERSLPLFPELEAELIAWLGEKRREGPVFPPLRCGRSGKGVASAAYMRGVLARIRDKSGHHWRGWHDFRHHYLSLLAHRGLDVRVIQELAGHSSLETTQRYLHVAPGYLDRARAVLAGSASGSLAGSPQKKGRRPRAVKR